MLRLVVVGSLGLAPVGCGVIDGDAVRRAEAAGIPRSHIVPLDQDAIGARVDGDHLEVVLVYHDADGELQSDPPWTMQIEPGTNSHGFASGSGLGLAWNTFLYGSAAPGVARVSSSLPDARGGVVVDGVWVIASPSEGLSAGEVVVTFLDARGGVVEQQ